MGKYTHHSYFLKEKDIQSHLLPNVCFHCRKSFKKPQSKEPLVCPQCGSMLTPLTRKFSAPKSSEIDQWHKVQFLVEHGFFFQPIYELRTDGGHYRVSYPKTLLEAKEFVAKYKAQAIAQPF